MRFALLFLAFISLSSSATTLMEFEYDELVYRSDAVVVGQIVSARMAACAAIYNVEVTRSVSGGFKVGQVITVGPYVGYIFGGNYLFFLDKTQSADRLIASTNSEIQNAEDEQAEECKKTEKPEFTVLMEGVGALEITDTYDTKGPGGTVHFPAQWISPPDRVKVVEDKYQKDGWGKDRLVNLDELLQ